MHVAVGAALSLALLALGGCGHLSPKLIPPQRDYGTPPAGLAKCGAEFSGIGVLVAPADGSPWFRYSPLVGATQEPRRDREEFDAARSQAAVDTSLAIRLLQSLPGWNAARRVDGQPFAVSRSGELVATVTDHSPDTEYSRTLLLADTRDRSSRTAVLFEGAVSHWRPMVWAADGKHLAIATTRQGSLHKYSLFLTVVRSDGAVVCRDAMGTASQPSVALSWK